MYTLHVETCRAHLRPKLFFRRLLSYEAHFFPCPLHPVSCTGANYRPDSILRSCLHKGFTSHVPGGMVIVGQLGGPGTTDPGLARYFHLTLKALITAAYGGGEIRQVVGADEFTSTTFDIVAKLPPKTNKDQLRLMLQSLMKERFHLAVHREQREMQAYALVVGKGGPKLTPSQETDAPLRSAELPTSFQSQIHPVDKDGYPLPPRPM